MEENPKMDSPHIKSSWDIKQISNPMGIGLGIDYVTWRKILKWISPHQIFMWDTK